MQCPICYGTGRNAHGGPCQYCRATGEVKGTAAAIAKMGSVGQVLVGLVTLAVVVLVLVVVIQA